MWITPCTINDSHIFHVGTVQLGLWEVRSLPGQQHQSALQVQRKVDGNRLQGPERRASQITNGEQGQYYRSYEAVGGSFTTRFRCAIPILGIVWPSETQNFRFLIRATGFIRGYEGSTMVILGDIYLGVRGCCMLLSPCVSPKSPS